jgi:hypothetical protein
MSKNTLDKRRLRIVINSSVVFVIIIFGLLSLYNDRKIPELENESRRLIFNSMGEINNICKRAYMRFSIESLEGYDAEERRDLLRLMDEDLAKKEKCTTEIFNDRMVSKDKLDTEITHYKKLSNIFLWLSFLFPALFYGGVFVYKYLYSVYPY